MIGVLFGISISLLLELIPMTGKLIDTIRGNQLSEQLAPELGTRDSQLEFFGGIFVVAMFLNGRYFLYFLEALSIDGIEFKKSTHIDSKIIIDLISGILVVSLHLVFPLILFCFAIEVGFSLIQKLNSKIQLGTDLSILKSGIGAIFIFLFFIGGDQPVFIVTAFYEGVVTGYLKLIQP